MPYDDGRHAHGQYVGAESDGGGQSPARAAKTWRKRQKATNSPRGMGDEQGQPDDLGRNRCGPSGDTASGHPFPTRCRRVGEEGTRPMRLAPRAMVAHSMAHRGARPTTTAIMHRIFMIRSAPTGGVGPERANEGGRSRDPPGRRILDRLGGWPRAGAYPRWLRARVDGGRRRDVSRDRSSYPQEPARSAGPHEHLTPDVDQHRQDQEHRSQTDHRTRLETGGRLGELVHDGGPERRSGGQKRMGNGGPLPMTRATAMLSPSARPMARVMAAAMPERAPGRTLRSITCHLVAPRARAASRSSMGTDDKAAAEGNHRQQGLIASTTEASTILGPYAGPWKNHPRTGRRSRNGSTVEPNTGGYRTRRSPQADHDARDGGRESLIDPVARRDGPTPTMVQTRTGRWRCPGLWGPPGPWPPWWSPPSRPPGCRWRRGRPTGSRSPSTGTRSRSGRRPGSTDGGGDGDENQGPGAPPRR